jgi:hypothetical protein
MPQGRARHQIHLQLLTSIPVDLLAGPFGHHWTSQELRQLRLAGTFLVFDSWFAFALGWYWIVELRGQQQPRDEADMETTAGMTEAGGGKATITNQHDLSLGEPASHERDEDLSTLDRRAMPFAQFGAGRWSQFGNTEDR